MAGLAGVAGCGLVDDCRGPETSSVSLAISADLVARDRATRVEVCVAGGQCETQPLPSPPASPARPGPLSLTSLDFTHVLPAPVTRQGSAGPPVLITVVLYAGHTSVLTSRAEVAPVDMNPGNGRICHYKGYWVDVELRDNGTIGSRLA
ncbi:MAG: hypothetical protein J2P15_12820 [Micromonosporaceae bacterium]|nr:hypothetical protein [Micromonosporaceae bacterium]